MLLPLLLVVQLAQAQTVKFKNGQLDNGLVYPVVTLTGNPEGQSVINANIEEIIADYKEQEYCIGQYGYVQKTNFLQLNFYFNCVDLDESRNEYHFFNLTTGEKCLVSELFLENQQKYYQSFFADYITKHLIENGKETPSDSFTQSISIDECQVELIEEGIRISIATYEDWPSEKLVITWDELRPFLKSTFI